MKEMPLMIEVSFIPLLYEYEVERQMYDFFNEYNFFDFYTTLQFLRDHHSERIAFDQNLHDEIIRLEQENIDDWGDDVDYEDDDLEEDEWEDEEY